MRQTKQRSAGNPAALLGRRLLHMAFKQLDLIETVVGVIDKTEKVYVKYLIILDEPKT